jgi:hypothetical protein
MLKIEALICKYTMEITVSYEIKVNNYMQEDKGKD